MNIFCRKSILLCLFLSLMLLGCVSVLEATNVRIIVDVDKPKYAISPMLFGIFFEDINLSADGGLYPELIRNRSFEDNVKLENWNFKSADSRSSANVMKADLKAMPPLPPLNPFNRSFLCIQAKGGFQLENPGYWGMNVVQGESYHFKIASRIQGAYVGSLTVKLVGANGELLASGVIKDFQDIWSYQTLELIALSSSSKATLVIEGEGTGTMCLDMISLSPSKTWKNHGLRTDLADAIDALQPRFFRFPGGCWVEGDDFEHMYNWKKTIGNIDTRTPLWNIWNYNATHGLGYHEYLQLSEDLGAEPLFCINAGVSHKEVIPMDQMGSWIQDALDAIEYANGPVTSVWGAIRAKNGHPKPFNMKYLEIGNENGQEQYAERWKLMAEAIQTKYPNLTLIANEWAGSHPSDPSPAVVDEHYYNNPEWFIWNANHYDSYDRKGPKIFIGEYAVTTGTGNGNLRGAIGEAAWMTGMERNSDIVAMGSYAPLLCNSNHKEWPVNLINFDSYRWFGLPSYYVQLLFAQNQGTQVLPIRVENAPTIEAPYSNGRIGLGTWNNTAEFKELKVVSTSGKVLYQNNFIQPISDWEKTGKGDWSVQNGVLKQAAIAQNVTAFVGDKLWKDYTITLKARKLSGENGFQIYFHNQDNSQRLRWDLGGYGNTIHMMEIGVTTQSIPAVIETGRWYDLKLEIKGRTVKGYIDGELVQTVADTSGNASSIAASASRDELTGDVILKVVNAHSAAVTAQLKLNTALNLATVAKISVLSSASALDENTLEQPFNVVPKVEMLKFTDTLIKRSFPANSVTIIRIGAK
jgi:alpha-L-arabinofuranosidase